MTTQAAWFFVLVVGAVLYGFWRLLNFTFDAIDKWHAHARVSVEDSPSNKGKVL